MCAGGILIRGAYHLILIANVLQIATEKNKGNRNILSKTPDTKSYFSWRVILFDRLLKTGINKNIWKNEASQNI